MKYSKNHHNSTIRLPVASKISYVQYKTRTLFGSSSSSSTIAIPYHSTTSSSRTRDTHFVGAKRKIEKDGRETNKETAHTSLSSRSFIVQMKLFLDFFKSPPSFRRIGEWLGFGDPALEGVASLPPAPLSWTSDMDMAPAGIFTASKSQFMRRIVLRSWLPRRRNIRMASSWISLVWSAVGYPSIFNARIASFLIDRASMNRISSSRQRECSIVIVFLFRYMVSQKMILIVVGLWFLSVVWFVSAFEEMTALARLFRAERSLDVEHPAQKPVSFSPLAGHRILNHTSQHTTSDYRQQTSVSAVKQ